MASKIMFDELPEPVKERINVILRHWKRFFSNAKLALLAPALFGSSIVTWAYLYTSNRKLAITLGFATVFGVSTPIWKSHSNAFRQEYLQLYNSLRKFKGAPELKPFFEKFPYISIDWKGNLVGKKTNPMIGRQVVGRRRIASPFLDAERRKKWWGKFRSKRMPLKP